MVAAFDWNTHDPLCCKLISFIEIEPTGWMHVFIYSECYLSE